MKDTLKSPKEMILNDIFLKDWINTQRKRKLLPHFIFDMS